jgi:hypothetical protein
LGLCHTAPLYSTSFLIKTALGPVLDSIIR